MNSFDIEFSEEKNELLRKIRGVCFDDVIDSLEKGGFITILKSKKQKYAHQYILIVKIKKYVHAVPFVWKDKKRSTVFLKTVYPDRQLHKSYHKKS